VKKFASRVTYVTGSIGTRELEHVSLWLNRGDSQGFVNERVWRH
jgi:hypothetical protein